jgi:hypothetical protein
MCVRVYICVVNLCTHVSLHRFVHSFHQSDVHICSRLCLFLKAHMYSLSSFHLEQEKTQLTEFNSKP